MAYLVCLQVSITDDDKDDDTVVSITRYYDSDTLDKLPGITEHFSKLVALSAENIIPGEAKA